MGMETRGNKMKKIIKNTEGLTRFSCRCNKCKTRFVKHARSAYELGPMPCPNAECGWTLSPSQQWGAKKIAFLVSEPMKHTKKAVPTKCGARCRNAKGPSCDCTCGGEFHGVDG